MFKNAIVSGGYDLQHKKKTWVHEMKNGFKYIYVYLYVYLYLHL